MRHSRHYIYILLLLLCSSLLYGCTRMHEPDDTQKNLPTGFTEAPPTNNPLDTVSPTPTERPADSYISSGKYTQSQILEYFGEVVLQTEFFSGSDAPQEIRKWNTTILYYIEGDFTPEDLDTIDRLVEALDAIPGFVGMKRVETFEECNLLIRFAPTEKYNNYASLHVSGATDGYATCWYNTDSYYFYQAEVGIRSDNDLTTKTSVILEELVQMLGIQNDSYLYPDSLFYQGFSTPQWPTELDWLMVRLLYHPEITAGMQYEECAQIIHEIVRPATEIEELPNPLSPSVSASEAPSITKDAFE